MLFNIVNRDNIIIKYNSITFDIYNIEELEDFIKNILKRVLKRFKLKGFLNINIYTNKYSGMIINIKEKGSNRNNIIEAKINFHIDCNLLYNIDLFDIYLLGDYNKQDIIYYKDKFYLYIKSKLTKKDFLILSELSELIFENTNKILENGIKLKI